MEIVIHGTKSGAKVFTLNKLSGLLDVSPNSPSTSSIGNEAYAIRFVENYTILSKYKIIRDVLGDKRTGFVAFSLFVPRNKKLTGIDIINVLDEISKEYCKRYIVDNNLGNVEENWDFINHLKYDLKPVDEHILSGSGDDAYVYFTNQEELQRYFDSPFQEEYKPFRQIYFVDENFNNKPDNPLNALRHNPNSNLKGKIDLDNPSYKLREYHGQGKNGILIEIRAEGRLRNNQEKIFRKDIVTVKYSKKYHMDIFEKGNLTDPQIQKYLKIFDNAIDVEKNIELKPVKIPIEIRICNSKGESINDAIITCKSDNSKIEKQVSQNTIIFSGEEQIERWIISAKKDSFIGEVKIIPENESSIKLDLREEKIIKLIALDEKGDLIPEINKNYTYIDDDIRLRQRISINVHGYETKTEEFIPNNVDYPITVSLERKLTKQIPNQNNQQFSNQNENNKSKEKNRFIIYFSLIALSIFCVTGIGYYFYDDIFGNPDPSYAHQNNITKEEEFPKPSSSEIESYIDSDSLILEKLNQFKTDWQIQTPNIESVFNNDSNSTTPQLDSTKFNEWKKIDESLDRAIKKRNAINYGNFAYFTDKRNNIEFPVAQQHFKNAIFKINKDEYQNVKSKLGDVLNLTLLQIADSINKIIETSIETNSNAEENISQKKKSSTKPNNNKPEIKKSVQTLEKTRSTEEKEIIEYLKGNELKIEKLKEFKSKVNSDNLKSSIDLALDFWVLDGSRTNSKKTYYSFKEKVQKDTNFKDSELLKFLKRNNTNTKYPSEVPGAKTKTLSKFIEEATK
jgi:hypothetical protein